MFGISKRIEKKSAPPPPGVVEFVFCVFDEKHRLLHHFCSAREHTAALKHFRFLADPDRTFDSCVMREAVDMHMPTSFSIKYGGGTRSHLAVLPYERKRGKWRYACIQVTLQSPETSSDAVEFESALVEEKICLMLVDPDHTIRVVGSKIPSAFGYTQRHLAGMRLSDLFSEVDAGVIASCSPDTNEAILSCVFFCLDGSRRDVEIRKYSAADHFTLYAICDVTPTQHAEELSQVATRERRRIGQDLHDSIGQMLTGISLLSRSLANSLKRIGNSGDADALQISALADDASNQIRQISRGLMPSEIVQKGLFDSLRELARNTSSSCDLLCVARIDETVKIGDGAVETHLYRIAQEAVNNSVRHSGASRIDIVVARLNGVSRLEVVDNGTWRDMPDNTNGIGMKTMEYRASAIGAHLKVGAVPDGGSKVVCVLEADDLMIVEV